MQELLNSLIQWCSRAGFIFSPLKTQGIIFNNKKNTPNSQISLHKTLLHFSNNILILRLTFDHKLSWKTHIKKLKICCSVRMNIIKSLSHLTWGSEQNSHILIYKSLLLSFINYGSTLYGIAKKNILITLDTNHN